MASEGILHRGCTSVIEAVFLKKKTGFLSKFSEEHNKSVCTMYFKKIIDLEILKEWTNTKNELPIENTDLNN